MDSTNFLDHQCPQARFLRGALYTLVTLVSLECITAIILAFLYRHDNAAWNHGYRIAGPFGYTEAAAMIVLSIWGVIYIERHKAH